MPTDAPAESAFRVRHLAELAFDLIRVADEIVAADQPIADAPLFALWQAAREIVGGWERRLQRLDRYREAAWARTWCDDLSRLAHEILAAELLFRVLGSILAAQDRQRGSNSARPIIEHIVLNVQHARSKTMELVVHAGDPVAAIDRFRRRCERWTDVLIGPVLARHGTAMFTHDPRRAWEFGEEQIASEAVEGAAQLMQAGFHAAFRDAASEKALNSVWAEIVAAILAGCPDSVHDSALAKWRDVDREMESTSLSPEDQSLHEDSQGWSLLARCLRIAEGQRKTEGC